MVRLLTRLRPVQASLLAAAGLFVAFPAAAGDAAVERSGLDLVLDEADRGVDTLVDRPGDLRLHRDREVAANVLEERTIRPRKIQRILRQPLHRLLARFEDRTPRLDLRLPVGVGIDEILDRPVNRSRVLIHAVLQLEGPLFDHQSRLLL